MSYNMEESLYIKSGLTSKPKKISGSGGIWSQKNPSAKAYKCFSAMYLFNDLFRGETPLVPLANVPAQGHKSILSFLLPEEILAFLEKEEQAGKIKASGRNNHYAGFFQLTVNDNKITTILHEAFLKSDRKKFIRLIQNHIAGLLKDINLSDNEKLIPYLLRYGDKTFVPHKESPEANEAFHKLLEKGDNDSLSQIIANFFVSCILGLRSMNYAKDPYTRKYPSYKTYLLSGDGMLCIWRPDLITPPYEQLCDSRRLYENACYEEALTTSEQWLKKYGSGAATSDREMTLAYEITGFSLYTLSLSDYRYKTRRQDGIESLKKCVETDPKNSRVLYFLYTCMKESDPRLARTYLREAFRLNYAKAVIETGNTYLKSGNADREFEDAILGKIRLILEKEWENSSVDIGNCLYLRAQIERRNQENDHANRDIEAAAKRGHERARQEMRRMERMKRHAFPSFVTDDTAPCCFTNTMTGNNLTVLSTFPDRKWSLYTTAKASDSDIRTVHNIDEFLQLQNIDTQNYGFRRPKLVFLFMSENEEKNLNECLSLLDQLFNVALEIQERAEDLKWKLIDAIDIFVTARYETASMLIDANISDMGNKIYFKVHITDPARDSVHRILCDAPLFIPALNGVKCENFSHVILFGGSETNYTFIKESIATAWLGEKHPISITLIAENADRLAGRFRRECPGIYSDHPRISCIRPEFIKCDIDGTDFPGCIYGGEHKMWSENEAEPDNQTLAALVRALNDGNYFAVDVADDLKNIRLAMELRTWLLRSRGSFDRAPFIAVKCADAQNSYLAGHLPLCGQNAGISYYNQYDLFPFGVSGEVYSYENMIKNPVLDDFALRIHTSYYGDNDNEKRAAQNDFYSYSYNADSSLSTAIGLCYRFFAANAYFRDRNQYRNFGALKDPRLLRNFVNNLASKGKAREKLALLSKLEQSRWNGFMLSRGWESADVSQVQAYKEQSTGSNHKHVLAKLHPFIREWDNLNDPDLLKILDILRSKFHYDKTPKGTTEQSIKDTVKFFRTTAKETSKDRHDSH